MSGGLKSGMTFFAMRARPLRLRVSQRDVRSPAAGYARRGHGKPERCQPFVRKRDEQLGHLPTFRLQSIDARFRDQGDARADRDGREDRRDADEERLDAVGWIEGCRHGELLSMAEPTPDRLAKPAPDATAAHRRTTARRVPR